MKRRPQMDVNCFLQVNGPVFIKYNSLSGDADLSGYSGGFRGVLFTPTLVGAARAERCLPWWLSHATVFAQSWKRYAQVDSRLACRFSHFGILRDAKTACQSSSRRRKALSPLPRLSIFQCLWLNCFSYVESIVCFRQMQPFASMDICLYPPFLTRNLEAVVATV